MKWYADKCQLENYKGKIFVRLCKTIPNCGPMQRSFFKSYLIYLSFWIIQDYSLFFANMLWTRQLFSLINYSLVVVYEMERQLFSLFSISDFFCLSFGLGLKYVTNWDKPNFTTLVQPEISINLILILKVYYLSNRVLQIFKGSKRPLQVFVCQTQFLACCTDFQ